MNDADQDAIMPQPLLAESTQVPTSAQSMSDPYWKPAVGTTWQWQLSGALEISDQYEVIDIDLFDHDALVIEELHSRGLKVICYISVGSWEDWRPDRDHFPESVIGKKYQGWPGERWLDIRRIDLLAPVIEARFDLCQSKGFDGVEPDNMDGYSNNTGFDISFEDQLAFNTWLADEAHARGLSIGMKNIPEQARLLVDHFDWALTESCIAEGWCAQLLPFFEAGKVVFAAEYIEEGMTLEDICSQGIDKSLIVILKNRELDAYRGACP
jgi:hypothetical protein